MCMFDEVHRYLEEVTPARPEVLQEMEGLAKEKGFPIVGPLVGRFLYQLATLTKAERILEMGSGFGYSAYWFSLAIGERGHIILTDGNEDNKRQALDFFRRAGLKTHMDFHVGDALELIEEHDGPFDIIFNDIDKADYPKTIELAAPRLRRGGLFITDNLIWSGKVYREDKDRSTQGIVDFTKVLYADDRFFTTIQPLRDGVSVAMRV